MTLSLYILRHAKAESVVPAGGGDHERALKRRGRRAASLVGRFLAGLGETPVLVLSSTAVRARETAEGASRAGEWGAPIELRKSIYEATPETLLREIAACEQDPERLLLVGHQPGLSLLIAELAGSEPAFPTGALARIDLELEHWSGIEPRSGQLAWLVTPETISAARTRGRAREVED
jgi:phosphohistidine phosphatase